MREVVTEIDINASPQKVWDVLTDFDHWQDWNPIVRKATGKASEGSTLSVTMVGKDGADGPMYKPVIKNMDEPRQLRWRAKMMAGFLFTNDKVFELQEHGNGTRLIHKELYGGLMVPIFWSKLNQFVPSMLNSMNAAAKMTAEDSSQ